MTKTVKEIADLIGGEVKGDDRIPITGINSLEGGSPGDISFFSDPRYRESLKRSRVSALIVERANDLFRGPQIVVPNPSLAYVKVAALFAPAEHRFPGISQQAVIDESSQIGDDVSIYPLVYVGKGVVIGDGATLFPGVFIGNGVKIGNNTVLRPNVTVMDDCIIGNDVIVHAGCVIGGDGFGFVRDGAQNLKVPQIGIVQIDDQVEIGANSTIDRAALGKTWIKQGVKMDNLVQIAHNVIIGEDTVIVAQTALGGSVQIGREVVLGGQVAISDHVKIGNQAMIGSQSGVPKSIPEGNVVSGTPAMPHRLWLKTRGLITRLPDLNERLRNLEKKIKKLESQKK